MTLFPHNRNDWVHKDLESAGRDRESTKERATATGPRKACVDRVEAREKYF
jgi:hypothetical protein